MSKNCSEYVTERPAEVDEDLFQDVISQFPFLNGYTHVVVGFELPPQTSRSDVTQTLKAGVEHLVVLIPWLGQQVEQPSKSSKTSHKFRPAPWPIDSPPPNFVEIRECDEQFPPFAELLRTHAPIAKLDGETLTPWPGLPKPHGIEGPVPILRLRANFIRGGLLLNLSLQHNIVDASGILQFMRLFATVLSGGTISATDLEQANRDRRRVIPLIPHGEPVKDHSHLRRPPNFSPGTFSSPPRWCYFFLPLTTLSKLKEQAVSELGTPDSSLSENDVICAFCWQRLCVVRLARCLPEWKAEKVVKFGRAIDGRMTMGIPSSYMGHMVYHSSVRLPMGKVARSPLSTVALALRRQLNMVNTEWAMRSFATFMSREPDKSNLLYGGLFDPTVDMIATGTTVGMGDAREGLLPRFGPLLGSVRFFRRPNTTPIPGTVTITPVEKGNVPLVLCLPSHDLDDLAADPVWRGCMKLVG